MSHFDSINNPELEQLEQSLQAIPLKPSTSQREQYLFQCGQATGRAEVKKRLRITSAFTGLFAMSTVCLSMLALNQSVSENNQTEPVVISPIPAAFEETPIPYPSGILRVSSRLEDLMVSQEPDNNILDSNTTTGPHNKSIMTTRSWLELFDN